MKDGVLGSVLIFATASRKVAATSLFASLLKPMWLSLIWTKLRSAPAARAAASETRLRVCDLRIPPGSWSRGHRCRPRPCIWGNRGGQRRLCRDCVLLYLTYCLLV